MQYVQEYALLPGGTRTKKVLIEKDMSGVLWKTEHQKQSSKSYLFPITSRRKICTLMLVSNLAYSQWINVDCHVQITPNVICILNNKSEVMNNTFKNFMGCFGFQFIKNNTCFFFVFVRKMDHKMLYVIGNLKEIVMEKCPNVSKIEELLSNQIVTLNFIFQAISMPFPAILFYDRKHNVISEYINQKLLFTLPKHGSPKIKHTDQGGYFILQSDYSLHPLGNNIFKCSKEIYISSQCICDSKADCNDKSDEQKCPNLHNVGAMHNNIYINERLTISSLFICLKGTCNPFTSLNIEDILFPSKTEKDQSFWTCEISGFKIHSNLVNDLVSDCGTEAEDEPILKTVLIEMKTFNCPVSGQIPCKAGHSKCYNLTDICLYRLDTHNHLLPCRTGGHLENCDMFECNMKFKCFGYYCIPWSYVCNGVWDCPHGYDEIDNNICTSIMNCKGFFKCQRSSICIHLGDVCDGIRNCPYGDDESMCEAHTVKCLPLCTCLAFAMKCTSTNLQFHHSHLKFAYTFISISFSQIYNTKQFMHKLQTVTFLELRSNQLFSICALPKNLVHLRMIDLGGNLIFLISKFCFDSLPSLISVKVDHNEITHIDPASFNNLTNFQFLNLSNNCLSSIHHNWLSLGKKGIHMIFISVLNNDFKEINYKLIERIQLYFLETTDYRLCCLLNSNSKCDSIKLWYQSCTNLLPSKQVKITVIIILFFLLLVNCSSLFVQIIQGGNNTKGLIQEKTSFEFIMLSINICDITFGIYLSIIFVADYKYDKTFFLKDMEWRSHNLCFTAFALLLLFNLLSPILLSLVAISRLMVVLYPFQSRFKRSTFALKLIMAIDLIIISVTLVLTTIIYLSYGIIPNSLCIPFVDPTKTILLFKILVMSSTFIQFSVSILIACFYFILMRNILLNQDFKISKLGEQSWIKMEIQLVIGSVSNFLCWYPTDIIYIMALLKDKYPINMIIWTVIVIMPINSIVNPLVFVLTSATK